MDVIGRLIAGLFALWAGAMVVGLLIAVAPVVLSVVGFVLMVLIVSFVGKLVGSWFIY